MADANCMWDTQGLYCKKACSIITDATICAAQSDCHWIGQLSVCLKVCSSVNPLECTEYAQCELQPGDVCVELCAFRHGSRDECNNDMQCEWYSKSGACGPRRCIDGTSAQCTADGGCVWNATGDRCQRAPCQWSDSISCAAEPNCAWYNANSTCIVDPCSGSTAAGCNAQYCVWNAAQGACTKACSYWGTDSECVSVGCDWTFQQTCQLPCDQLYGSDKTSCQRDDNCLWDSDNRRCTASCSKLAQGSCKLPLCQWSGQYCKPNCANVYRDNLTACALDPTCEVAGQICIERCRELNASACASVDQCLLVNGTCMTSCGGKYGSEAACTADDRCLWFDECVERCEVIYTADNCTEDYCTVINGECATRCKYSHLAESDCVADPLCRWSNGECAEGCETYSVQQCPTSCSASQGRCIKRCSDRYGTISSCNNDPQCQWNYASGSCAQRNCTGTDKVNCLSSCAWIGNTCLPPCSDYPIQGACAETQWCFWNSQERQCSTRCSLQTAASCAAPSCFVVGSTCQRNCSTALTAITCAELSIGCLWDASSQACSTRCEYRYDITTAAGKLACNSDPFCHVENGQCISRACGYTSQAFCLNDQRCRWANGTCAEKGCDYSDQVSCQGAGCSWLLSPSGSSCEPSECLGVALSTCAVMQQCLVFNGTCYDRPCFTVSQAACSLEKTCTWNVTSQTCGVATLDCEYTPWSSWSSCSFPCGNGTQRQTRAIVREAQNGGVPCDPNSLVRTQPCNNGACNCSSFTSAILCASLYECQWSNGLCYPSPLPENGCSGFDTQALCINAPGLQCVWGPFGCTIAPPAPPQAFLSRQLQDEAAPQCPTGAVYVDAAAYNATVSYVPGQSVQVFPNVIVEPSVGIIDGVTVSIINYTRGLDLLYLQAPVAGITALPFQASRGILVLNGPAHVSTFAQALQAVMFYTSASTTDRRAVVWTLGLYSQYLPSTGHLYYYNVSYDTTPWWAARADRKSVV